MGKSDLMSWGEEDLWGKKSGAQTAKLFLGEGHKRVPQSSNPAVLITSWLDVQARLGGAQAHLDSGPFSKGSWNHGMGWDGRDAQDHPVPTPTTGRDTPTGPGCSKIQQFDLEHFQKGVIQVR